MAKKDVVADNKNDKGDGKSEALKLAIAQITKQFGDGSIMKLGETPKMDVELLPSGSLSLDLALGGGYPKGRIIEIYGPESSGKTTLALHAIAEIQKQGGQAAFIDAEHALDPAYAKKSTQSMRLIRPTPRKLAWIPRICWFRNRIMVSRHSRFVRLWCAQMQWIWL